MSKSQLTIPADFPILLKEIKARIQQTAACHLSGCLVEEEAEDRQGGEANQETEEDTQGLAQKVPGDALT